jgi:hypothetical protein
VLCEVPSEYDPDLNIFLFGSGKTNWQLTFQITET